MFFNLLKPYSVTSHCALRSKDSLCMLACGFYISRKGGAGKVGGAGEVGGGRGSGWGQGKWVGSLVLLMKHCALFDLYLLRVASEFSSFYTTDGQTDKY